ncbi:MAG: transketolase C-terminal domain-containing protein [Vulcanimicrobiota bacterium]
MAESAAAIRARQALAEILSDWELCWLLWPASNLARQLAGGAPSAWFDIPTQPAAVWAQQMQAFFLAQQQEQPLLLILEAPQDLERLHRLHELASTIPWLLVILLDPAGYFAPVPSSTGWFQRSAEPPAYAWSSWLRLWKLDFWGSLSLEDSKPVAERLDEFLQGAGRRLLHLYGPALAAPENSARAVPRLSLPDSLESAFLEQWKLPENARLLWCAGEPPTDALWVKPEHAGSAAWGVHQAGSFPVLALSAGQIGSALQDLLPGLPPGCLVLVLEAGLCWESGQAHLSPSRLRDLALLRQVHGLALACPADVFEAAQLTELSYSTQTPVAVRLTQAPAVLTGLTKAPAQAGRGHRLRPGANAAILALGPTVYASLLAAEALSAWGLECQVWDVRFLKPLDREMLEEAAATGHILTVEEHCLQGGLATMALETLSQMELSAKLQPLALPPTPPILAGTPAEEFGLDADGIQKAMRKLLGLVSPESFV